MQRNGVKIQVHGANYCTGIKVADSEVKCHLQDIWPWVCH